MYRKSRRCASAKSVQWLFSAILVIGGLTAPAAGAADEAESAEMEAVDGLEADPEAADADGWWGPNYLVDYGIITAGTAGYFIGERLSARSDALVGPSYDPDDPTGIFESDELSRPFAGKGRPGETFPNHWLQGSLAGLGVAVAGFEGTRWAAGGGSGLQTHEAVVGFAEAATVTASVTSGVKLLFGRLRPDFGERALRYHCTTEYEEYEEYCEDYRNRPLADSREEADELMEAGRRSFFSAHASHSFNMFTYSYLLVGGHYVWGDGASTASRIGGIAAQTAMIGSAGYITGTRLYDNRHHVSDVVAGSLVGVGIANLAYWRRFDSSGNPRAADGASRLDAITVRPFGAGPGLSVSISH